MSRNNFPPSLITTAIPVSAVLAVACVGTSDSVTSLSYEVPSVHLYVTFSRPVRVKSAPAANLTLKHRDSGTFSFASVAPQDDYVLDCLVNTRTSASNPSASTVSYSGTSLVDDLGRAVAAFTDYPVTVSGPTVPMYARENIAGSQIEVRWLRRITANENFDSSFDMTTSDGLHHSNDSTTTTYANGFLLALNSTGNGATNGPHAPYTGACQFPGGYDITDSDGKRIPSFVGCKFR